MNEEGLNLGLAEITAIERHHYASSLYEFFKAAWPILEPARPLIDGWHLKSLCAHLEAVSAGKLNRLAISIPPGFCKPLVHDTPILTTCGWKKHGDTTSRLSRLLRPH